MALTEYNYIIAVAEEGSFSKAAKRLFIAQPSLSQAVQKVERTYDCEFFIRTQNGLQLTPEGKRYVDAAYSILQIHRQMELDLCKPGACQENTIFCGTNINHGKFFMPQTLHRLQKAYPSIHVHLLEGTSNELEDKLLNGVIDFSVMHPPIKNANIECALIKDERFLLVVNNDHPLSSRGYYREGFSRPFIDLKLFMQESFILAPFSDPVRDLTDRIFEKAGFLPKNTIEIRGPSLQLDLCAMDSSIALIPQMVSEEESRPNITYFNIEDEYNVHHLLWLATVSGRYLSKPVKDFIQLICTEFDNKPKQ